MNLLFFTHIGLVSIGPVSELLELRSELLRNFWPGSIVNDDIRPRLRQGCCDGLADARVRTSDKGFWPTNTSLISQVGITASGNSLSCVLLELTIAIPP